MPSDLNTGQFQKKSKQTRLHMRDDSTGGGNRRRNNVTITKSKNKRGTVGLQDNTKWRKLNFYYGTTIDQLPSHRPQGFQKLINKDNLLNSLFCNPNPAT